MKSKYKNPFFWIGVIGVFFSAANVDFTTLTTWVALFDCVRNIFLNPVTTLAVITAVLKVFYDKGKDNKIGQ